MLVGPDNDAAWRYILGWRKTAAELLRSEFTRLFELGKAMYGVKMARGASEIIEISSDEEMVDVEESDDDASLVTKRESSSIEQSKSKQVKTA